MPCSEDVSCHFFFTSGSYMLSAHIMIDVSRTVKDREIDINVLSTADKLSHFSAILIVMHF